MRFEVVENWDEWIVRREGVEVARFSAQEDALAEVAERLRTAKRVAGPASLTMRYQQRQVG